MRPKLIAAAAMFAALCAADVSAQAQVINLSGQFQCVQGCLGPGPAYITQNGWELNLVKGAVYSPDGMTIQFDNGSVWQRFVPPPALNSRG
jgi:hypothetical protein